MSSNPLHLLPCCAPTKARAQILEQRVDRWYDPARLLSREALPNKAIVRVNT
jgi:hypothetical protein